MKVCVIVEGIGDNRLWCKLNFPYILEAIEHASRFSNCV